MLTALAACSEESPANPNNQTRSGIQSADSTSAITLTADSAWADTIDVNFDADTTTVTVDTTTVTFDASNPGDLPAGNAQEAASRRQ